MTLLVNLLGFVMLCLVVAFWTASALTDRGRTVMVPWWVGYIASVLIALGGVVLMFAQVHT